MKYYCKECCIVHYDSEDTYYPHMSASVYIDLEYPPGHWIWDEKWNDNHHLSTDLKGKDV